MRHLCLALTLLLAACGESHGVEDAGATGCDGSAPTCLAGWNRSSVCCLEGGGYPATCRDDAWMCGTHSYLREDCGRVDPICEGPPPYDAGTPGCTGTAPRCHAGWSGTSACCLTPSTAASCSDDAWTCPGATFRADVCGRIDDVCEGTDAGPPDGGPFTGLYDDCTVTSQCTLTANTCCGVCGMPSAEDVAAVTESRTEDYYLDVACPEARTDPPICPDCLSATNPHLAATCDMRGIRPACAVVDLAVDEYASCSDDEDCVIAAPGCCRCDEVPTFETIAVRRDADLGAVFCDDPSITCPPCVPTFDERAAAVCRDARCVLELE